MELIRVGNFELRPSERMLCCEGRPVDLGARAFDLLCGEVPAALQLGRPLALSLRQSGHRESRFELLAMTWRLLTLGPRERLDEAAACSLALGLRA